MANKNETKEIIEDLRKQFDWDAVKRELEKEKTEEEPSKSNEFVFNISATRDFRYAEPKWMTRYYEQFSEPQIALVEELKVSALWADQITFLTEENAALKTSAKEVADLIQPMHMEAMEQAIRIQKLEAENAQLREVEERAKRLRLY